MNPAHLDVRHGRTLAPDSIQSCVPSISCSLRQHPLWLDFRCSSKSELFTRQSGSMEYAMAKKTTSGRKPTGAAEITVAEEFVDRDDTPETATSVTPADEMPAARTKARAKEEQPSNSSVGIADIRKAVAFSNSVGGLDNAIALLQILKVAKEVQ